MRNLQVVNGKDRIFKHGSRETYSESIAGEDNRQQSHQRLLRNSFLFLEFSLIDVGIYLDGQMHCLKLLKLNFVTGLCVAAYAGLCGADKINRDEGDNISHSDYVG
jgi:hypothetical protein